MIDFLSQIEILLLNMKKMFKTSGFLVIFVQNSRFFQFCYFKISQILGF